MSSIHTNRYIVVGPPGCGKTHHISQMVRNAVEKEGKSNIAVCSLTRTAAVTAAGRVNLHRSQVGTLHAFAYRGLGRPVIAESKIKAFNEDHPLYAINSAMLDRDPDYMSAEPRYKSDWYEKTSLLRAQNKKGLIKINPSHARAFQVWTEWKDKNGYLDFTDLIERAIDDVPNLPGSPSIIFVDEQQDMSALEMKLLDRWAIGIDKFVTVGDPYQALYTWRGADNENFIPKDFNPRNIRTLSQSYRVPARVLGVARNWLSTSPEFDGTHYKYEPTKHEGSVEKPDIVFPTKVDPFDDSLLSSVAFDASEGKSVMVLAACGYMLNDFVLQMRALGIPFHNPYRKSNSAWNPLTAGSTGTAANARDRIEYFLRPSKEIHGEDARLWTEHELSVLLKSMLQKHRVTKEPIIEDKELLRTLTDDSKRFSDTIISADVLRRLFNRNALRSILTGDMDYFIGTLKKQTAVSMEYPLKVFKDRGYATLMNPPSIIVGTIHSVKGGECDSVYLCPDIPWAAWQGILNDPSDGQICSVYRQFYVGMTRTKDKLTLCDSRNKLRTEWEPPYLCDIYANASGYR